jgi:Protein of unknown function (DUF1376).
LEWFLMPSPVFPLYHQRWIASTRHLSHEARSIYLELLIWQFDNPDKVLRNSTEFLKKLVGVHALEFKRVWREISPYFKVTPDGGLVNESLQRKINERSKFIEAQRKKAKKGAAARWGKKDLAEDAPGYAPGHLTENAPGYAPGHFETMPQRCPTFSKDHIGIADQGVLVGDLSSEERSPAVSRFLMKKTRETTRNDEAVRVIAHHVLRDYPQVSESEREELVMEQANRANLWFNRAVVRQFLIAASAITHRKETSHATPENSHIRSA